VARDLVPLTEAEQHRRWATARRLRRLVDTRAIPFHRIGRRIYFDLADLDAYAEAGRTEPPRRLRAVR
jgi:excisionase family DNA binding protein